MLNRILSTAWKALVWVCSLAQPVAASVLLVLMVWGDTPWYWIAAYLLAIIIGGAGK